MFGFLDFGWFGLLLIVVFSLGLISGGYVVCLLCLGYLLFAVWVFMVACLIWLLVSLMFVVCLWGCLVSACMCCLCDVRGVAFAVVYVLGSCGYLTV